MEQKVVHLLFAFGTKSRTSAFCQWNKKLYLFLPMEQRVEPLFANGTKSCMLFANGTKSRT
jgi:hypothetical protein